MTEHIPTIHGIYIWSSVSTYTGDWLIPADPDLDASRRIRFALARWRPDSEIVLIWSDISSTRSTDKLDASPATYKDVVLSALARHGIVDPLVYIMRATT